MDLYGNQSRSVSHFEILDSHRFNKLKNLAQKPIKMGVDTFKDLVSVLPEVKGDSKNSLLKSDFFSKINNFGDLFAQKKNKSGELKLEDIANITVNFSKTGFRTKVSPALELIQTKTSLRSLTFLEKLMSYGIDALKLLLSLSSISKKIQGFRVGYKKIERGIKLNQFIVAFGEIFYNKKTQELKMTDPICLLKNKAQMIKKIKLLSSRINRQLGFMLGIMSIMSFLVVRRVWKNVKKLMVKIRSNKELVKMENLFRMSEAIEDEYKCIICCELPKHVIFKPCLHMACCAMCYEKLEGNKCFICKQEIEDVVKIYVK